ncbi:MAG: aminopeptidase P family protein [Alphaproteobacteria bacterium]|nr:aminopeptidase P family protein [Alphaproteobacteria bacterium]
MSKNDFPKEEFAERLGRVRRAMADQNLDWLLVFSPISMHWLIGSDAKAHQVFQCLIVSTEPGPLVIFGRAGERSEYLLDTMADDVRIWGGPEPADPVDVFSHLIDEFGLKRGRVGMEVPAYYLHPHHYVRLKTLLGAALVAEPTDLINDLKVVKSPREIAYVRRAAEIADLGMVAFRKTMAEGKSELEVCGAIYHAMLTANGGIPASTLNLSGGERSAFAHGAPTERRFKQGDFGNVEYGGSYRRYHATIGRNYVVGKPTARMKEIHDLTREASDAAIAEIRDGVAAIVPHEAAKRVIATAGLGHARIHTTGYGIAPGFPPSWGEPINMNGGSTYTLAAGMVLSIEPPIYLHEERLGARLIDNVLVTKTGAELLSRDSRDLIVI